METGTFYETYLCERKMIGENEFCETWEFTYKGTPVILRQTKAKAGKTDEIFCAANKLTWRRSLKPYVWAAPYGFPEETVISNAAFARRGAICVFVVSGKPNNFRWIDQHEWIRADNPDNAAGKIYLMSEPRFLTFEPSEHAKH